MGFCRNLALSTFFAAGMGALFNSCIKEPKAIDIREETTQEMLRFNQAMLQLEDAAYNASASDSNKIKNDFEKALRAEFRYYGITPKEKAYGDQKILRDLRWKFRDDSVAQKLEEETRQAQMRADIATGKVLKKRQDAIMQNIMEIADIRNDIEERRKNGEVICSTYEDMTENH